MHTQYKTPRRESRFPVRIPVNLRTGGTVTRLYTGDISFRGLFICTDSPPVLRQLISIELALPPDDVNFKSHAMSVYVLQPGQEADRMPGVGVQFYAQSEGQRRQWERFVTYIKQHPPDVPADAIDPVKRAHPRIAARFEVHPKDLSELEIIYTRDVSTGGMFIETDMQLAIGKGLSLTIYHPVSHHGFTMDCTVKRHDTGTPKGLGVEFINMDDERREKFHEFVQEGLAALSDAEAEDDSDIVVEVD